jgi:hypothetical protein
MARVSLVNFVPERGRIYVRRFDHEEAAEWHRAGMSIRDLADHYGVTYEAVRVVVTAGEKRRSVERQKRWRTITCEHCGGPAMKLTGGKKVHNPDGRILCGRCRSDVLRERLRFDELGNLAAVRCSSLDCAHGSRWQAPENFSRGQRHREVRKGGIHGQCRDCQTRARRLYRRSRMVPCEGCGQPTSPRGKEGRRTDTQLCNRCIITKAAA